MRSLKNEIIYTPRIKDEEIEKIIKKKNIDKNKIRLSIGSGDYEYSNCINFELTEERNNSVDVLGDVRRGLPFEDNFFNEVLMIHVIEHIERKFHNFVFGEINRVLKINGRLICSFPDFIQTAKAFIENRHGRRWDLYNSVIYGRQDGTGDYHVTAIERQDITDRLFNNNFVNVKYILNSINATVVAYKSEEKIKEYL